jgi:hypothetical protein
MTSLRNIVACLLLPFVNFMSPFTSQLNVGCQVSFLGCNLYLMSTVTGADATTGLSFRLSFLSLLSLVIAVANGTPGLSLPLSFLSLILSVIAVGDSAPFCHCHVLYTNASLR